jgi:hypothetical protein
MSEGLHSTSHDITKRMESQFTAFVAATTTTPILSKILRRQPVLFHLEENSGKSQKHRFERSSFVYIFNAMQVCN